MRVGVIGAAGKVGSSISYSLIGKVDELMLVDIAKDRVKGEFFDLSQASDGRTKLSWGEDPSNAQDCDVVIIPAGFPRTPEMKTRMDLFKKNAPIVKSVVKKVAESSPNSVLIVISNPMDIMTYLALKVSGFNASKVMGMGSTLDSRRLRWVLSKYFNQKVDAITIGEHGEYMIPLLSQVKVGSNPLDKKFIEENRENIVREVKDLASNTIKRKGGTWWGPAKATMDIVDAIVNGPKKIPVSVFYKDVCVGLPAQVGRRGISNIFEPEMDSWESAKFNECLNKLNENCRWVDTWLK
jgi:malate dehydrogenase